MNKCRWPAHLARQEGVKWTTYILKWRPRLHIRNIGRPPRIWVNNIRDRASTLLTGGTRKGRKHMVRSGQLNAEKEEEKEKRTITSLNH
ncbi:hypothetical protein Trydic_g8836 [Trypoxylus dichotomus]